MSLCLGGFLIIFLSSNSHGRVLSSLQHHIGCIKNQKSTFIQLNKVMDHRNRIRFTMEGPKGLKGHRLINQTPSLQLQDLSKVLSTLAIWSLWNVS